MQTTKPSPALSPYCLFPIMDCQVAVDRLQWTAVLPHSSSKHSSPDVQKHARSSLHNALACIMSCVRCETSTVFSVDRSLRYNTVLPATRNSASLHSLQVSAEKALPESTQSVQPCDFGRTYSSELASCGLVAIQHCGFLQLFNAAAAVSTDAAHSVLADAELDGQAELHHSHPLSTPTRLGLKRTWAANAIPPADDRVHE